MNIDTMTDDKSILSEIGQRLSRRRVETGLTQADLAREAGVSKRTVERVEAGESTQSATLIRLLRVLGLLDALNLLLPESGPRPLDLLKLRGKQRQRASGKKRQTEPDPNWTWKDEP